MADKELNGMRGLGYALIIFGIISAVIILLYNAPLGWSGLTGSIVAIMTGMGFLAQNGTLGWKENDNNCGCGCNRY